MNAWFQGSCPADRGWLCIAIVWLGLSAQLGAAGREEPSQSSLLASLSRNLEDLARRVEPAVVQIFVSGYAAPQLSGRSGLLVQEMRSGSGVIVSPEGYIVTNAHVVRGAQRVQVRLAVRTTRVESYSSILKPAVELTEAQMIGIDQETDLAILRVSEENLPFLEFGDSDGLRQSQLVLAFGSPLGLENSVTLGVVSSVARQLEPEDPMIYIQTDAPINPGSSGGPLVNTSGELVGINTLILSQSGGNEGIGLAAPSNIVKHVYQEMREQGRVRRGSLGIRVQTITPLLAAGLALPRDLGVIVADVPPGSAADFAGLKPGDLILTLDGRVMENARQLEVNVYSRAPAELVALEVLRGSRRLNLRIRVVEREDDLEAFSDGVTPERNLIPRLGILGLDLTAEIAGHLPPPRKLGGVLVLSHSGSGPYGGMGLFPGDVIHQLNGKDVSGLSGLRTALQEVPQGAPLVLQVQRQGGLLFVALQED